MSKVQLGTTLSQRRAAMKLRHCVAGASSLALAVGFATPGFAQVSENAPPTAQAAPSGDTTTSSKLATAQGNGLGDIVVTARRVQERLQDIPASVSAVTGDQVARMSTLADISSMVSGVTFKNYGPIPIIGIRGFGNRTSPGLTTQSTVGIYEDGVFVAPPLVTLISRVDTERVEVAKGPQSTLYGRSSFIGAINIVTNDPAKKLSGYIDGGYGGSSVAGENIWHIRGAISVPITDTLGVRFFGDREKRDGYVYDPVTGNRAAGFDRYIGRARVLWEPNDVVTARLTGTIMRDNTPLGLVHSGRTPAPLGQTILFGDYVLPPSRAALANALTFGQTVWQTTYVQPVSGRTRAYQGTFDLRFKTPFGELAWLTDYQHTYQDLRLALDLTRLNIARGDTPFQENRWSQEIRLSNKVDRVSYLLGLYYLNTVQRQAGGEAPDPAHPTNTFAPDSSLYDLAGALYLYSPAVTRTDAYAAFGQVGFDFTDRLNLTLGLRQGHDEISGTAGAFSTSRLTGITVATTPIVYRAATFNATTGSANLSYKIQRDVVVYGSYARGDSPGGLNTGGAASINYGPQRVDAFELGLKSQFLDRHLQINVALFDNQYKQLQLSQNVFINGAVVGLISNAGKAYGRGVDLDAVAVVSPNLRLGVQYTYARSKLTDFTQQVATGVVVAGVPQTGLVNFAGAPLVRSPRHTLNASATFTHEIGGGKLLFTGEESYTSSYTNDYQGTPAGSPYPNVAGLPNVGVTTTQVLGLFRTPGYAVTNLNASYTYGNWELSGYVRNLLNHQYIAGVLSFGNTIYPQELPGEPRTFEVSLKYSF